MNIAIVGTGYVGLVTGTCLAEIGHRVVCIDTDAHKIDHLRAGKVPIFEPGLEEMIARNVLKARLRFSTDIPRLDDFEAIYLAVGTPQADDGSADLRHVAAAARAIAPKLSGHTCVVIKSTVPPGTADMVDEVISDHYLGVEVPPYSMVSNPEFLKEGDAIRDFSHPARVVVGVRPHDTRAEATMRRIYAPILREVGRFLLMDNRSAELAKYANNGMLATRVSFMNEISETCEIVGADIDAVRRVVGSDPRIGPSFLFAGPGWGGSCWPKDLAALARMGPGRDRPGVVSAALEFNANHMHWFSGKVVGEIARRRRSDATPKVGIWGVAFKPGTDDVRESPALALIERLADLSYGWRAYDPVVTQEVRGLEHAPRGSSHWPRDMHEACRGVDALVLVTEWPEFKTPDWAAVKAAMRGDVVIDGRNLWDRGEVEEAGLHYVGVGRGVWVD